MSINHISQVLTAVQTGRSLTLSQQIQNLTDLIRFRLPQQLLEVVCASVMEELFTLRSKVLGHYREQEAVPRVRLASNADALIEKMDTIEHFYEKIGIAASELVMDCDYATIRRLARHPAPPIRYLKYWVDASLKLEFGLIVAELSLTGQYSLSTTEQTDLSHFLQENLVEYGAYSMITGYWSPDDAETSVTVNRMELLAAKIEMENRLYFKSNSHHFYHLLHH